VKQTITVTIRGTEKYHMENYLVQEGYEKISSEIFISQRCECQFIYQKKIKLGIISITEVQLAFIGISNTQSEVDRFKMKFMTAGG